MAAKNFAAGTCSGSASKIPSTRVAFRITSALISMARKAAAVSVEKYGFPVPAAKITTRFFSRCRIARRRINGSETWCISMALSTPVNVSAADHDGDFHAQRVHFFKLARDRLNRFPVNAEPLRSLQRLAGKFQQDPLIDRLRSFRRPLGRLLDHFGQRCHFAPVSTVSKSSEL